MKKGPVKESDFERRVCEVLVKRLGGEVKEVNFYSPAFQAWP
jgi:hypothetical protein